MSYKLKLKNIKNFVFDVDGVFTDGSILVDSQGEEYRTFNTKDICVISGGNNEGVRKRLDRLGVRNVYLGVGNKKDVYLKFLSENDLKNDETVYMGDDLPDEEILKLCGLSTCPYDACPEIREIVDYISIKKGGDGCVRDIIEQVLRIQENWKIYQDSKNI